MKNVIESYEDSTMARDKKHKKGLKLENNSSEPAIRRDVPTEKPRVISFDVYFQGLMQFESRIQPHHKAPMKKYAEQNGLLKGTKEEFDRIFRLY